MFFGDRFVMHRAMGCPDPFMSPYNDIGGALGKNDPPPAPDYVGAANATAAGNLEAARANSAANKVNQVTPYGNLTYSINGKDSYGNDLYTATQTLSPAQQAILNQQTNLTQGLLGTANSGLQYANDVLTHPGVDLSKLPSIGINPGQTYQDAMMSRLQPQIDRENEQSDAQLANQGITPGSEAYINAKTLLNQSHNDLLNNAVVQGFNTGLNANQSAFQQQAYNQMQPINMINALRTGSQVQNPTFASVPQQQATAGPDILGATQAGYQSDLNAYNAQNMASSNLMNGLFSLGGAYLMKSDMRLKRNIKRIGVHPIGVGIYEYDIEGRHEIGVIAQEVEKVKPQAVIRGSDGYLMVNYGAL